MEMNEAFEMTSNSSNSNASSLEQMNDILREFFESFNNQSSYLLASLYVPVIALAIAANTLVIIVVFKFQSMRRYVSFFYFSTDILLRLH